MDFRDPLFSVIMFFIVILISVLITIGLGKLKEYYKEKRLNEFFKDFEYIKIENLALDDASIDALYLLAKAYEKEGDFEKSLKIYLWINKNLNSIEILKNISKLYYKAGFLEKAKKTAYQILQSTPRDIETLKLLILINEKINNIAEIKNILDIFDELEIELLEEKAYLEYKTSLNDFNKLLNIYEKFPCIKREFLIECFNKNPKLAYEKIDTDVYEYLDLFWHRNDIPNNEKFLNILAAKHIVKCDKKALFEIEVLKEIKSDIADLEFEYICNNCKKIFPIYSSRCPNCNKLFTQKLVFNLVEKKELKDIEF